MDEIPASRKDEIRKQIEAGVASLRAGEGVDGEAVFDRIEAELALGIDEGPASLDPGEGVEGEEFMQKLLDDLDARESSRNAG